MDNKIYFFAQYRNVIRCLEHCVQQLTYLTDLLDAVLTKCCNLVIPDGNYIFFMYNIIKIVTSEFIDFCELSLK